MPSSLKQFEVLNKLGQGSFATVFKVKRIEDSRIYAMKKMKINSLNPKEVSNALNEIRILASISNPYIIGYKDAFIDEASQSICIITQFAQGGDVANKIASYKKRSQLIDENQIWRMAIQMINGLKVLHGLKIFHRDLKAANIFLTHDQNVKLGDLNVSIVSKNGMAYTQTGTPYYACPEVWNDKPYNYKSDIWSLGCVLYEIAAQKPPFTSNDMKSLCKKINKGIYDRIPIQYTDDLVNLIGMCLKVDASQRPSTDTLLKHTLIRKRIHMFPLEDFSRDFSVEQFIQLQNTKLLQTIRVPRYANLKQIKQKLPRSNYQSKENKSVSLSKGKETLNQSIVSTRAPLARIDNLVGLKRASSTRNQLKKLQQKNSSVLQSQDRPVIPKPKRQKAIIDC